MEIKQWVLGAAILLAAQAAAATEWVRAVVVRTDEARGKVTLRHEPIRSIRMEAMTMPFKVKDKALLAGVKAGHKVRFTVAQAEDELVVTALERVK